jgi:hypothetical protein
MSQVDVFYDLHVESSKRADLVDACVWAHFLYAPSNKDTHAMLLAAYPDLAEAIDRLNHNNIQGETCSYDIPLYFLHSGDERGLISFLTYIVERKPENFPLDEEHLTALNEMQLRMSAYYQKVIPFLSAKGLWIDSNEQRTLRQVMGSLVNVNKITSGKAFAPVVSAVIAKALYLANDIPSFAYVLQHLSVSGQAALIGELSDIWVPIKQGFADVQRSMFVAVANKADALGPAGLNGFIVKYWGGIESYITHLTNTGDKALWTEALHRSLNVFNIDSVQSPKQIIMSKQLFPLLTGTASMAVAARAAGVDFCQVEHRLILKPLEVISKTTGDKWIRALGSEYTVYKNDMKTLYGDVDPADVFSKPLPKNLAHMMSTVLDNSQWVSKTNLKNRGQILMNELGI